ncbi:MAG: HAD family hydrolase [Candidatus Heimdallarchaeota archaeon]|nr:MAG: HAD family hydrolase [Candidatus Heimdallarchaeota archaeon]
MMIKAVLVDFDGVLVDATNAYMKATNVAMKNFKSSKVTEDEERYISLEIARRLDLGISRDKLLDGIISIAPDMVIEFIDLWLRTWNKACLWEVELLQGVDQVLIDLSKRFPLALVTLRHVNKGLIEDQLKRLKLNRFFKTIITALDVKKPKPDPASFVEGAERIGVAMEDCIIVGDSITDIRAGKAGGAKTIAVLTGIFDEKTLRKEEPDLIIGSITEILKYLK